MLPMRKFLVALFLLVGVMFIITRFTELEAIVSTIQEGDWRFIAIGLILEFIWLVNIAASFRAIYKALDVDEKLKNLILTAAAANFVNVVTPTGGVGGMAIFISEGQRRNCSAARVTVASALYVLFDYAGFLCVLTLGVIVLIRRDNLNPPEIIASGIMVIIVIFLAFLLFLGTQSEQALGNVLAWGARTINKILRPILPKKHRQYLSEARAHEFAHDAVDGIRCIKNQPKNLIMPALLALSSKALMILILFMTFMAFRVPLSIGTLIAGFSIAFLFSIVSPTPSGVGIVEGTLTLALHSFFIPLSASAVIAIVYRGITFWVPLLVGMFAFRALGVDTDNKLQK
jgi:uncharacterized protein (TIRG00374 family)